MGLSEPSLHKVVQLGKIVSHLFECAYFLGLLLLNFRLHESGFFSHELSDLVSLEKHVLLLYLGKLIRFLLVLVRQQSLMNRHTVSIALP